MATARKDAARCLNWIDATTREPLPDVQLDNLISSGTTLRKRLQACKESLAEAWDPSWTNNQYEYVKKLEACSRKYDEWLGRWQRARAEAEAVGLRRPPAVLQRGVSALSLARGTHARVPARGRAAARVKDNFCALLGHAMIDAYPKATTDHYLRPTRSTPPTPSPSSRGP